jgi:bacillopeptidase F (M6 metalloprotease family)
LEYSEDGEAWKIIPTMSCSSLNKSGNSYGCGWNDISGGWVKESVDLSFLSGKKVYLRFEYITDAAVNGEGLMLDDMEISAVNYKTDFETDDGGWDAKGFVRIQNKLPQSYRVTLIEKGNSTTVTPIKLDASNKATIPVSIGGDTRSLVLVVSGTTRFSRQEARYLFNISK